MADLTKVDPQHPVTSSDLDSDKVRENFAGLIEGNIQKIAGVDGGFLRGFQIKRTSATVLTVSPGVAHISTTAGQDLQKKTTSTTINFATTGINALDTGTVAADTWYYIWIARETATGNLGFVASLSTTTPTNPSGWVFKRLIDAWWRGDATTGLKPGFTVGRERDRVRIWSGDWDDVTTDSLFQVEGSTASTEQTLDLSTLGGIPPADVTDALLIYPTKCTLRFKKNSGGADPNITIKNNDTGAPQDVVNFNLVKNKTTNMETEIVLIDKTIKYTPSLNCDFYLGLSAYAFHA